MECAGADGQGEVVAGLGVGVGGEAGDVVGAAKLEMDHRFVAHVFDDVERDVGERQAVAVREQIFGADAERGGAGGSGPLVDAPASGIVAAVGAGETRGRAIRPAKKFIAGLPMNEATKRFAGRW